MVDDLLPGESTISNENCGYENDRTIDWTSGDYSFAESYAVWGWA